MGVDIIQTAFKNHPEILKTNWTYLDADSFFRCRQLFEAEQL